MRNRFLEKSFTNCGGETISRLSSIKSKLSISLDKYSITFYSLFLIVWQVEGYRKILKLSCKQLASTSQRGLELASLPDFLHDFQRKIIALLDSTNWPILLYSINLASLPHFLHDFGRKIFALLHFINWPHFIVWLSLLREILRKMCIAIVVNQVVTSQIWN